MINHQMSPMNEREVQAKKRGLLVRDGHRRVVHMEGCPSWAPEPSGDSEHKEE